MEILKQLKSDTEIKLKVAKEIVIIDKFLPPLFYGLSVDDTLVEHDVPVNTDEDINNIPAILDDMALAYSAIILIIDINVNEKDKEVEDIEKFKEHIEEDPDTTSALYCAIYTNEGAVNRILKYDPDTSDFFHDSGWKNLIVDRFRIFLNPYDKINIAEHI